MSITDPMRHLDSRTVQRKIKSGRLSETEYREFIAALPDVTDNIRAREDGGDDDGYEERIANRGRVRPAVHITARLPIVPVRFSTEDDDDDDDIDDDDDDDDDDDLFAEPAGPAVTAKPAVSPVLPPVAPPVPLVSPLPSPSFELPPLDAPLSPSAPVSAPGDGSKDRGE